MKEAAIEVKDLCIDYRGLKTYSIKKNLLHLKRSRAEVFHAVKHVSFTLEKGEILGIIGKNGSGKSTMLQAIAGIFSPNQGEIDLHGNSVSLLSIGVGFQRELTGRENIVLSGDAPWIFRKTGKGNGAGDHRIFGVGRLYRCAGADVFQRNVFKIGIFYYGDFGNRYHADR